MGQINVNVAAISGSISKFKTLQSQLMNDELKSPETVGGGSTVGQLEEIAKVYAGLNAQMGALLSATISFLENAKNEYHISDNETATKMKREIY